MKRNTASRTAQYMALFRAIESKQPAGKRLFEDPYAHYFLDKSLQIVANMSAWPLLGKLIPAWIDRQGPGAISSGIARTKYIDDLLEQEINRGVEQVIILGAGFDTRAFRLPFLKKVVVIEMDHPSTAQFKLERLRKIMPVLPPNVSFQQIDFNQESLESVATKAQLDFDRPTLILWEGVTNYLTEAAVGAMFEFTRRFSRSFGIIFTYIDQLVLDQPDRFVGTKKLFANLQKNEERWTFGFYPTQVADYLAGYDLHLVSDLNATDYRNKYMAEQSGLLAGYEFYRVVLARR